MVGDAIVVFVLNKVEEFVREQNHNAQIIQEMRNLKSDLDTMKLFLGRYRMHTDYKSDTIKHLVSTVVDFAYKIEDVVDASSIKRELQDMNTGIFNNSVANPFRGWWETANRVGEIEKLRTEAAHLKEEILPYLSSNTEIPVESVVIPTEEQKADLGLKDEMVGFEEVRREVIEYLTDSNAEERTIITIVGMGGAGKTTLTREVYHSPEVNDSFGTEKIWITVSKTYEVKDILRSVLMQVSSQTQSEFTNLTEIEMRDRLREYFEKRKYLVVLDDIWDAKPWENLEKSFPENRLGSMVLITTRNHDKSENPNKKSGKRELVKLRSLTETESLLLFKMKVSGDKAVTWRHGLEEIAQNMMKKCRGLPLAIVALGGLLSTKEMREDDWEEVYQNMTFEVASGNEEMVNNILSLSYYDLPCFLRPCFLYFGLFPEDEEIDTTRLIWLWVAEGFITIEEGRDRKTLEQMAESYLVELVRRCLVRVIQFDALGAVIKCHVHDLVRDVAVKHGRTHWFLDLLQENANVDVYQSRSHRLGIHDSFEKHASSLASQQCLPRLRSVMCFQKTAIGGEEVRRVTITLFGRLKMLRVVYLDGLSFETIPEEIGSLVMIRYLLIKCTRLRSLPSSLKRLRRLQTLDVYSSVRTRVLDIHPSVWALEKLRHMYVHPSVKPPNQVTAYNLYNLQTLETVMAGDWILKCDIANLKLTSLRRIKMIEILARHGEKLKMFLEKQKLIRDIELEGTSLPNALTFDEDNHVFLSVLRLKGKLRIPDAVHSLDPRKLPLSLTEVELTRSMLEQDPLALLEGLPSLKILKLLEESFVGQKMTCSSDGFPQLQELYIKGLGNWKEWIVHDKAMEHLKSLETECCPHFSNIILPRRLKDVHVSLDE